MRLRTNKSYLAPVISLLAFSAAGGQSNPVGAEPRPGELLGSLPDGMVGRAVSGVGDFNGDGRPDLLLGAPGASPEFVVRRGISYLVFGSPDLASRGRLLEDLSGGHGMAIPGLAAEDYAGISVGGAGDINGDGLQDLLIAATGADPGGFDRAGTVYVVFGHENPPDTLNLASLNGEAGFAIHGSQIFEQLGTSIDGAGDFNGDGIDDLIVGARFSDALGRRDAGASYLIFGSTEPFESDIVTSSIGGSQGVVFAGASPHDASGSVVGHAGDVNGDGFADVIIGAPGADIPSTEDQGAAYVVFGDSSARGVVDLSSIDGSNGFLITGLDANGAPGRSAGAAGDVNGDGIADVIVGQRGSVGSDGGSARIVFGRTSSFPNTITSENLTAVGGVFLQGGAAERNFGHAVGPAGDLNKDGIPDVAVSSFRSGIISETYILFGGIEIQSTIIDTGQITGNKGITARSPLPYSGAGFALSAAGDINGDGTDDLLIGIPLVNDDDGGAYLLFGPGTILVDGFEGGRKAGD